jgi:hypothetical protein
MRILTYHQLDRAGACHGQLSMFRHKFGSETEVTEELALSVAQTFNWDWAASHLLSEAGRAEYTSVKAAAWAEYYRVLDTAWPDGIRVSREAWAECNHVGTLAWAECYRVRAAAWARLYIADGEK